MKQQTEVKSRYVGLIPFLDHEKWIPLRQSNQDTENSLNPTIPTLKSRIVCPRLHRLHPTDLRDVHVLKRRQPDYWPSHKVHKPDRHCTPTGNVFHESEQGIRRLTPSEATKVLPKRKANPIENPFRFPLFFFVLSFREKRSEDPWDGPSNSRTN